MKYTDKTMDIYVVTTWVNEFCEPWVDSLTKLHEKIGVCRYKERAKWSSTDVAKETLTQTFKLMYDKKYNDVEKGMYIVLFDNRWKQCWTYIVEYVEPKAWIWNKVSHIESTVSHLSFKAPKDA